MQNTDHSQARRCQPQVPSIWTGERLSLLTASDADQCQRTNGRETPVRRRTPLHSTTFPVNISRSSLQGIRFSLRNGYFGLRNGHLSPRNRHLDLRNGHLGLCNRHFGPRNRHFGPRNCHFGPRNRHFGPRNRHFGLRNDHFGLRNDHFGPPNPLPRETNETNPPRHHAKRIRQSSEHASHRPQAPRFP